MNKKFLYAVIVLLVVCTGVYFIWINEPMVVVNPAFENEAIVGTSSNKTSGTTVKKTSLQKNSKTSVDSKNIYVVTYTDDGFKPSELQVPRGATVTFVNKTNTAMRIFANENAKPPFSDLNQPKTLGLNGEYSFNFVYSGIWQYNNSLHADDVGSIVVY